MEALCDEVGRPGLSATETSASSAMELTRTWLEAMPRTWRRRKLTLASLTGVARTSAVIEVTRLSAITGHDLRPHPQVVDTA
jgi:hypothetical protein